MIPFRAKVKDSLTGAMGYVNARIEYMNGCVRYAITPLELKEGKPQEDYWLDEQQVIVIDKPSPSAEPAGERPGGPREATVGFGTPPAR